MVSQREKNEQKKPLDTRSVSFQFFSYSDRLFIFQTLLFFFAQNSREYFHAKVQKSPAPLIKRPKIIFHFFFRCERARRKRKKMHAAPLFVLPFFYPRGQFRGDGTRTRGRTDLKMRNHAARY